MLREKSCFLKEKIEFGMLDSKHDAWNIIEVNI